MELKKEKHHPQFMDGAREVFYLENTKRLSLRREVLKAHLLTYASSKSNDIGHLVKALASQGLINDENYFFRELNHYRLFSVFSSNQR